MKLKARISWNDHHAYIDLATDKGYNAIIRALKRIHFNGDYYSATTKDVQLKLYKKHQVIIKF